MVMEMENLMDKTDELINKYGNQAYHMAIHFVVIATTVGDQQGAEFYSKVAKELMGMGYHKFLKTGEIK